ncbi:MAG: ribonuclease P protein component [Mycoplasmoidaceae bacterium]
MKNNNYKFKKKNSLKKKEFDEIYKNGKQVFTKYLIIKSINLNASDFQIGISVPKKNFKLSVSRNKVRRQIKDIIRKTGFENGKHLIIVKKNYNYKSNYINLKNDIQKLREGN